MRKNPNIFVTLHAVFQTYISMKIFRLKPLILSIVLVTLLLCSCGSKGTNGSQSKITAEMAFEGVSNYCHSEYDWSIAKDNPDIMYVQMGEETDSAYQVIFRSYTGAFVNFYVDKASGTTRVEEYVPNLDIKEVTGKINLFDYLNKYYGDLEPLAPEG